MTPPIEAAGRAGFFSRTTAYVVDTVLLALTLRGTIWVLEVTGATLRSFSRPKDIAAIGGVTLPLIVGVYLVACWRLFGQTPGKWLLGLKVVAARGGRMTVGRAALRFLGYLLSAIPFYLGFLWILGPRRSGWHDRLAGTEVVYLRPRREVPRRRLLGVGTQALGAGLNA